MPLIATLTLNPAMDLSVSTARVISTEKLRCSLPRHDPGGGGIHVARVVKTLGGRAIAIYPAGGPFGDLLQRSLDELGLEMGRAFEGKEGVSPCRFRWSTYHKKQKTESILKTTADKSDN